MADKTAASRMRKMRSKKSAEAAEAIKAMGDDVLMDGLRESVDMLRRSGLPAPSPAELGSEPPSDRALGISRIISAATKAVALGKARGELITAKEHQQRLMEMAGAIKHAIGQFGAYLPGDLTPEERERCAQAMQRASNTALQKIERQ